MQKLPCEASPQGKMSISIPGFCNALLSNGGGLGRSLSYVGRSQISVPMMLHRSVMHKWPFPAASEAFAWNRCAKVAFQSYLAAFAWNRRAKVASRAFACNCCAKAALQNYFLRFCVELSCKSCVAKLFLNLLCGAVLQKLPFGTILQTCAWHHRARIVFFSKLFLELFHGTVVQNVSCKAVSQNFIWICCAQKLSGRGLGRSLSYVGRSQISLSVMLHAALVHKLPCEAVS